jgi:hypothetical protein
VASDASAAGPSVGPEQPTVIELAATIATELRRVVQLHRVAEVHLADHESDLAMGRPTGRQGPPHTCRPAAILGSSTAAASPVRARSSSAGCSGIDRTHVERHELDHASVHRRKEDGHQLERLIETVGVVCGAMGATAVWM